MWLAGLGEAKSSALETRTPTRTYNFFIGPGGEACGRENIIKSETSYLIEEGYRKRRNLMDKASLQEYSERSSSYLQ
jgi:hypothetical protein